MPSGFNANVQIVYGRCHGVAILNDLDVLIVHWRGQLLSGGECSEEHGLVIVHKLQTEETISCKNLEIL